jgi:tRNA(Ile)-lysidine synthase TilS/MesJ
VKFELEVCTVDPMTPSFDPSPLIPYVESLGLKYHYLQDGIVARAESSGKGGQEVSSLCSFCARMKRGKLYTCARENKCNKLVLAQHLDDCAESFMMSVMHNGFLRTMQANYIINAGDLSVIRPFVYCRERLMTDFAKTANLPVINENCPACFEEPKERARIKKLLSREESLYPNFFENIRRSLIPLMHADSTAILRSYLDETLAQSKSIDKRKRKREYAELRVSSSDDSPNGLSSSLSRSLKEASDEDLLRELALRRAGRYRLAGASKFTAGDEISGPACSSSGGCTNVD